MRIILSLSILWCACIAFASNFSGKIRLANGRAATNAVVYLEGGGASKPLAKAMIDQRNRTFIPHVAIVTIGTKVAFPNDDTIYHNVFADYEAKRFDLGMYARGQTKYVTFPRPGVVSLMCSVHPDMSAYIMVVDTPYYAITDSHGEFNIGGVPPGEYAAKAWHESGQTGAFKAQVGSGLKVDITLSRRGPAA